MSKAKIECTCRMCGKTFWKEKACFNRKEANKYEAWVAVNVTLCPDCYCAERDRINAEQAQKWAMPQLTAKSEKQMDFALKMRNEYAIKHAEQMDDLVELMKNLQDPKWVEKAQAEAKKDGTTIEDDLQKIISSALWKPTWACLHETNAWELLEVLKRAY